MYELTVRSSQISGKILFLINKLYSFLQKTSKDSRQYNILVLGQSGHGKSSFINSVCGLKVAEVSAYGDCTSELRKYSLPGNTRIKFFDCPGISATGCKQEDFVSKSKLDEITFDLIFLIMKEFVTTDVEFMLQTLQQKNKSFWIVRTFADVTVDNEKEKKKANKNLDDEVSSKLKQRLIELFHKRQFQIDPGSIYIISNKFLGRFEFKSLLQKIYGLFPDLLEELISFNPAVIQVKYDELSSEKYMMTLAAGASGLIPLPGADLAAELTILTKSFDKYLKSFGLDKKSIKGREEFERDGEGAGGEDVHLEAKLEKFMRDRGFDVLLTMRKDENWDGGLAPLTKIAALLGATVTAISVDEYVKSTGVLFGLGMAVGALTNLGTTFYLLNRELKNARDCALYISEVLATE